MKTVVQELVEKLAMKSGNSFHALAFYHDNDEIIKEALEKEKEQIKEANIEGTEHGYRERAVFGLDARPYSKKRAEEYYNERYK